MSAWMCTEATVTCCCGASVTAKSDLSTAVELQLSRFNQAHEICRVRRAARQAPSVAPGDASKGDA
ncbi:MAG: hypothetical protein JWP97_2522 [Labilithrix sp.]|nr:hypothetical protein [Labilithrix sp.]